MTEAVRLGWKISKRSEGFYIGVCEGKFLGQICLIQKHITLETLQHEIQHSLLHYIVVTRLKPYDTGSYANEKVCYAAGKIMNEIVYNLTRLGISVPVTKTATTKNFYILKGLEFSSKDYPKLSK